MSQEISNQDYLKQQLQQFNVTENAIAELKDKYLPLEINGIGDKDGYRAVSAARKHVKSLRIEVEKKRKDLNTDAIAYQRAVNEEAKRVTSLIEPIENDLQAKENAIDNQIEKIKQEKIDAEMKLAREKKEAEELAIREEEKKKQEEAIAAQKAAFDEELQMRKDQLAQKQKDFEEEKERIRIERAEKQAEYDKLQQEKMELMQQKMEMRHEMMLSIGFRLAEERGLYYCDFMENDISVNDIKKLSDKEFIVVTRNYNIGKSNFYSMQKLIQDAESITPTVVDEQIAEVVQEVLDEELDVNDFKDFKEFVIKEGEILISIKEYNELKQDSKFLRCLESSGVDSWPGYKHAQEMMETHL